VGAIVINGTGISGLVSALLLCEKGRGRDIIMVEKNQQIGGLLRRFNYEDFGDFDYGMHNFLETGIKQLDDIMFDLLPKEEWQILDGPKRDLAGIYINGKLQPNTPYIDLRSLTPENYKESLTDFLEHLDNGVVSENDVNSNAYDYAVKRFGKITAENTIVPSLEKIHKKSCKDLDYMATLFTPMSRIAFCDEALVAELTQSRVLRDRIAWSDQRSLPLERSSLRKAIYPVKYGAYRVVDAIEKKLKNAGVTILNDTQLAGIVNADNRIKKIELKQGSGNSFINDVELMMWTGNIPMLGKYLNVDFTGIKSDKPLKTVIVNLLLDKKLEIGDLYYFFCYDKKFNTFRLTNYINYSSGAQRNGGYPICIELLIDDELISKRVNLEEMATKELFEFNITQPGTKVLFAKAEILDSGFPMPSVNNILGLKKIRNKIRKMNLKNLILVGVLAEDNLFFQTDVLIDLHKKIGSYE